jgi:hypothetical protein
METNKALHKNTSDTGWRRMPVLSFSPKLVNRPPAIAFSGVAPFGAQHV